MKTYCSYHKNIQISVFAKTGTSFMDRLVLEDKILREELPIPDAHYISVREPLDRFISGFITFYRRLENPTRKDFAYISDALMELDLLDAFKTCYDLCKNNWKFDGHTELVYKDWLPLQNFNKIVKYIDFREIGLLCDLYNITSEDHYQNNYIISRSTLPLNDYKNWYLNSNSINQKQELYNFLISNNEIFDNIKSFLKPDIEIYQNLPIHKIKA